LSINAKKAKKGKYFSGITKMIKGKSQTSAWREKSKTERYNSKKMRISIFILSSPS
jgi:hypothetical protein